MKKIICVSVMTFLLFGISFSFAEDFVTIDIGQEFGFEWTANSEPDLAGYRIYESTISGQYTYGAANAFAEIGVMAEPETPRYTKDQVGTYYYVVTAFDTEGYESGPSNEVYLIVENEAPDPPSGCAILRF